MYDIADTVRSWLADDRRVQVAQVVATRGFSSREPGSGLAWTDDGAQAGALFAGLSPELDVLGAAAVPRLVDVAISDAEATSAGLSCGGVATVLVQPASALPVEVWDRLARREPLCLVTSLTDDGGETRVYLPGNIRDAAVPELDVPRRFARGVSDTALVAGEDGSVAVVSLWPMTSLLVVGDGSIADALVRQAELLDWTADVTDAADSGVLLAADLRESDAIVVLSHDREVDVPVLVAALAGRCGYVGALGSRGTQAARRELLTERGVDADEQARIHGPAGLDIDAHTPAEIAISIVAEVLGTRSGSSGGSISERPGPVHVAGVNAPPPRYTPDRARA